MSFDDKPRRRDPGRTIRPPERARPAPPPAPDAAEAMAEIELWTTRDGREIPLAEMSDRHVASAIRVLSAWRNGLRKKGNGDAVVGDLSAAIDRFRRLERDRRRAARAADGGRRGKPPREEA